MSVLKKRAAATPLSGKGDPTWESLRRQSAMTIPIEERRRALHGALETLHRQGLGHPPERIEAFDRLLAEHPPLEQIRILATLVTCAVTCIEIDAWRAMSRHHPLDRAPALLDG